MAPRRPAAPPLQQARLAPAEMRAGIDRLQKRIEEVKQFDPSTVTDQYNNPHIEALAVSIEDALGRTFGKNTTDFVLYADAAVFDNGPFNYAYPVPIYEVHQSLNRSKARSIALLEQAVRSLEEQLSEEVVSTTTQQAVPARDLSKVFVVHGHDDAALQGVARFLERLELTTIILKEQPDQGRTIIEKFEACAKEVGFAVVLLTPDDLVVASAASGSNSRARQNVIFELGYFAGKLGRGRACLLRKGDVEMPSDLFGVIYKEMDAGGGWKLQLAQEMKAAGLKFDANKVFE